jgi:hypothetical protein
MALKDLWSNSRAECEARTIQQIMSWAGALRDGSTAATEFREYLDLIPASLLARYCDQCLASPFQDSGLALQDLINHVGKRLGFDVEFGRYRGSQTSIGFDGIWKFPSGHWAVIEVKTTSAYQIRLETIAQYRLSLIEQAKLLEDRSSILVVVGRDDTTDLEAQIRGSRYAWDMRLISIDALLRLLSVKEDLENPNIVRQIQNILIPREFTKLDAVIEFLFSTASDLRPDVDTDEGAVEISPDRGEGSEATTFQPRSMAKVEKHLGVTLLKQTRSSFVSADKETVVVCKASRAYMKAGRVTGYWFGFYEFQMEMITGVLNGFAAFQCGSADKVLLIPSKDLLAWSAQMNRTETKRNAYWHVHIDSEFRLIPKAGAPIVELSGFLLPLH